MKCIKHLILILLIINFCLSNEYFNPFLLTQNLNSESFPTEPTSKIKSTGIFQNRRNRGHPTELASGETTFGIIVAEFLGGLLSGAGGAIIVGFIGSKLALSSDASQVSVWDENPGPFIAALMFGAIGWTFGCAGGTCLVGSAYHQRGKFLPTLLGAFLGLPLFGVGTPFGSVIGYNMSRPKPVKQTFLYQHFELPAFCFRTERTKENKIIPVYDFRLVNARF